MGNSTLGSSFFRHYDIYFDRDHKKISFVRSECDDKAARAYPVHGIRALIKHARVLLSSMFAAQPGFASFLVCLLALLTLAVGVLYKNVRKDREEENVEKMVADAKSPIPI